MKIKIVHLGFSSFQYPAPTRMPPPPLTQFQALKLLSLTLKTSLRLVWSGAGASPVGVASGRGGDKCQKVFTPTVCRGKLRREKERKLKRQINGKKTWSRANWLDCDTLGPTHSVFFRPSPPFRAFDVHRTTLRMRIISKRLCGNILHSPACVWRLRSAVLKNNLIAGISSLMGRPPHRPPVPLLMARWAGLHLSQLWKLQWISKD